MPRIKFMVGEEKFDYTWARFEVKGLEQYQINDDPHKKPAPSGFQYFEADAPEGTIFTVDELAGDYRGTDEARFAVCQVTGGKLRRMEASQCDAYCVGAYVALVEQDGVAKAARLKATWEQRPSEQDAVAWASEQLGERRKTETRRKRRA